MNKQDRKNRIEEARKIAVIDNSIESLLFQAKEIASFLKYYNFSNESDGYFDLFLHDLNEIREKGIKNFIPDGQMEPSQALLLTFIHHLYDISQSFNQRFKEYSNWYVHHYLNLKPLSLEKHKVCLSFQKNIPEPIVIEKGFGFVLKENKNETFVYKLSEDTLIENISIENILALYFCKQKNIYPASIFDFVTSLRVKDLRKDISQEKMMFTTEEKVLLCGIDVPSNISVGIFDYDKFKTEIIEKFEDRLPQIREYIDHLS